jgi:hypothetical protein
MAEKSGAIITKIDTIHADMKNGFATQADINKKLSDKIDELTIRLNDATNATAKKARAPAKEKTEKTEKAEVKQPFPTTSMYWFKRNMKAELSFMDQFIDDKVAADFKKRLDTDDEYKQLPDAKQSTYRSDLFWKTYCMDKSETKNVVVIDKIKKAYNEAKKDYEQKNKTPASKE